jgi:hypothetical protein
LEKNMDRQELIQILTPGLVKSTGAAEKEVRKTLETYDDISVLEKELSRQRKLGYLQTVEDIANDPDLIRQVEAIRAEARQQFERDNAEAIAAKQAESDAFYRNYYLDQAFNIVFRGKRPVRNIGSENIVIGWLNPGESLSAAWLIKVLTEQPGLAEQLQWRPAGANQGAVDRKTFSEAARQFRLSDNIANFNLACQTLGEGFSAYQVQQVAGLSPATKAELDRRRAEDITERQDFLINRATTSQLKAAARDESSENRAREEQQQANDAFEAARQRDQAIGFPPLPQELTKEQIRNAPVERLKFWIKKFGNANVNARLQDRG